MARIPPLDPAVVNEKFGDILKTEFSSLGALASSHYIIAYRPKLLAAITNLSRVVMHEETTIPRELKWFLAYTVSSSVECRYCQAHTSNFARILDAPVSKIKALWNFEEDPQFSAAERAALRVARAAGYAPSRVTDEMFVELKKHWSNEQIVDIVSVISHFGWFNRWNDTFASDLEDEPLDFALNNLDHVGWTPGKHISHKAK